MMFGNTGGGVVIHPKRTYPGGRESCPGGKLSYYICSGYFPGKPEHKGTEKVKRRW